MLPYRLRFHTPREYDSRPRPASAIPAKQSTDVFTPTLRSLVNFIVPLYDSLSVFAFWLHADKGHFPIALTPLPYHNLPPDSLSSRPVQLVLSNVAFAKELLMPAESDGICFRSSVPTPLMGPRRPMMLSPEAPPEVSIYSDRVSSRYVDANAQPNNASCFIIGSAQQCPA